MVIYKSLIFSACFIALIEHGNSQKLFGEYESAVRPPHPSRPREYACSDSDLLSKIIKFVWPNPIPTPPDAKIILKLYTRGKKAGVTFSENGQISNLSALYAERKTVIITHGFLGHSEVDWIIRMTDAYLNYANVNVIVVDWAIFAQTINYYSAAFHTKEVGKQIAHALYQVFIGLSGLHSYQPIHMIGFSLGAHVVGVAAEEFKKLNTTWKVERITGLDPAFPCFEDSVFALDKRDAPFVDIIHTNGHESFGINLGLIDNIGHVDFYVNGGQFQPGCRSPHTLLGHLPIVAIASTILSVICSHMMAPEYFIASLEFAARRKRAFKATLWNQELCSAAHFTYTEACVKRCIYMGITAKKTNDNGIYYVIAANQEPFNVIKAKDQADIVQTLERCVDAHSFISYIPYLSYIVHPHSFNFESLGTPNRLADG